LRLDVPKLNERGTTADSMCERPGAGRRCGRAGAGGGASGPTPAMRWAGRRQRADGRLVTRAASGTPSPCGSRSFFRVFFAWQFWDVTLRNEEVGDHECGQQFTLCEAPPRRPRLHERTKTKHRGACARRDDEGVVLPCLVPWRNGLRKNERCWSAFGKYCGKPGTRFGKRMRTPPGPEPGM